MADLSAFDVFIGYIIYGLDCSITKIFKREKSLTSRTSFMKILDKNVFVKYT